MFNLNLYKKKFRKLLLPINKIIDSFFDELTRSKYSKNKKGGIKKNFIRLDQKIESFFNKFKEIKKYNQSKKILNVFENDPCITFNACNLWISVSADIRSEILSAFNKSIFPF